MPGTTNGPKLCVSVASMRSEKRERVNNESVTYNMLYRKVREDGTRI